MMFEANAAKVKRGENDRISQLPDFVLHLILSKLDTKEACRTSVLSKKWYGAWSSVPFLDFQIRYFKSYWYLQGYWDSSKYDFNDYYDFDTFQSFLGFIDRTMQRYFTHSYRIVKLFIQLPMMDEKIESLVDKWFKIAVQSQVEELDFKILFDRSSPYRLPEILFRSKSLTVLNCENVVVPYYNTMELISLRYLTLNMEVVDIDLLQRIVSFCPLVELDITIDGLKELSLPWTRNVNAEAEFIGSGVMESKFKTSPLQKFAFHGMCRYIPWPWNMNVVALKNLRKLEIAYATITDGIVSELAHRLVALESLVLNYCTLLNCIELSSFSLKELQIVEGLGVGKVTVDAPNLLEFGYNCEVQTRLSLTSALDHCRAQFIPFMLDCNYYFTTDWLVELKKTLVETNFFTSLVIDLCNSLEIEVEEEQLRNVITGPSYKLRELKLREPSGWYPPTSSWIPTESSLMVFLDGLLWCCHPDVLSMTSLHNLTVKSILNILKHKVQCYKHPLRSIEVEGVDCSSSLSEPSDLEIRFRLSWF